MTEPDFTVLLDFFRVLGNESRLRLVGLLAQRPHSVDQLAAALALKEPTVSHHLARLKALGLVSMRRDGNTHIYALDREALTRIGRSLFAQGGTVDGLSAGADPRAWENKVLQSYLSDGRLVEMPASRRKRRVVLAHLVGRFEEGRAYPEKAVNEALRPAHEDVATIRREFIGYNMMRRQSGTYWRMPEAAWRVEP